MFSRRNKRIEKSSIRGGFKAFKIYSWFTVFKQQFLLEAISFIKIQRGARLKLEAKFLLKLRETKTQKKLIRIAVPSEHLSTNSSKQLDTYLQKFLDISISSSKINKVILMGL